jgi:hypothetical protein
MLSFIHFVLSTTMTFFDSVGWLVYPLPFYSQLYFIQVRFDSLLNNSMFSQAEAIHAVLP